MAAEEDLTPREDFDPRFYESLGTQRPQCASRFGGHSTASDHDHQCEYDADIENESDRCCFYARIPVTDDDGEPVLTALGQQQIDVVKQPQPHECACGQAVWSTGQTSVALDGSTIVS